MFKLLRVLRFLYNAVVMAFLLVGPIESPVLLQYVLELQLLLRIVCLLDECVVGIVQYVLHVQNVPHVLYRVARRSQG